MQSGPIHIEPKSPDEIDWTDVQRNPHMYNARSIVWKYAPRALFPHFNLPPGTYQVPDDEEIVNRTPSDRNICLTIPPVMPSTIEEIELRLNFAPFIDLKTKVISGTMTISDSSIRDRLKNAFITSASISFDNPSPYDLELVFDGLQNRVREYGCEIGEHDITCTDRNISAVVYAGREINNYPLFKDTSKQIGKEFEKWGMLTKEKISENKIVSKAADDCYDIPADHVMTYYLAINRRLIGFFDRSTEQGAIDGVDTLEAFVKSRHHETGFAAEYFFPKGIVDKMSTFLENLVDQFNKRDLSKLTYKITGLGGKDIVDTTIAQMSVGSSADSGPSYMCTGKLILNIVIQNELL